MDQAIRAQTPVRLHFPPALFRFELLLFFACNISKSGFAGPFAFCGDARCMHIVNRSHKVFLRLCGFRLCFSSDDSPARPPVLVARRRLQVMAVKAIG